jgi:hypothetical protein
MLALESGGDAGSSHAGKGIVQSAHPRDVAALVLVVGVFLILFVLSVTLGAPAR